MNRLRQISTPGLERLEEGLIALTAISCLFCIVVTLQFGLLVGWDTGYNENPFDYNIPCHVGLPDDMEEALSFGALPAANGSSSTLPKVGLCTMMTLAYEEHTLLHWVAYHNLLGFDAIWIYVDDRAGGLVGAQRYALHQIALQLPPEVTLRYVSMTPGVTRQPESVQHCLRSARADGFDWIAHWDGDEYPVLGPPVTANAQLQASPFDVKKWLSNASQPRPDQQADGVNFLDVVSIPRITVGNIRTESSFLGHREPPVGEFGNKYFEGALRYPIDYDLRGPVGEDPNAEGYRDPRIIPKSFVRTVVDLDPASSPHTPVCRGWYNDDYSGQWLRTTGLDWPYDEYSGTFEVLDPTTFGGMRLMHYYSRSISECKAKNLRNRLGLNAMVGTGESERYDRGSCAPPVVSKPPPQDNTLRQATDLVNGMVREWPVAEGFEAAGAVSSVEGSTARTEARCAVLFFGLVKSFKGLVLPKIRQHVLGPNSKCDVFVHSYNISSISNARNGEVNAEIRPEQARLLGGTLVLDTAAEFVAARNLSYFREFFPRHLVSWNNSFPTPIDNMIKQWHSIDGVWRLMVAAEDRGGFRYARVGMFRSDVLYRTDINISDGGDFAGVVPGFNNQHEWFTDRMIYGPRSIVERWAQGRFPHVARYVRSAFGRTHKLHSERFLYHLMMHGGAPIKIEFRDICFQRVRANGQILYNDCEWSRLTSDSGPAWTTRASRAHLPAVYGLRGSRATTWEFLHIPKTAGTSIEDWGWCIGYFAEHRRTDRAGVPIGIGWKLQDECGDEGGWPYRLPPSYPAMLSTETHPKICPSTTRQSQANVAWDDATWAQDADTRSWALFDWDAWDAADARAVRQTAWHSSDCCSSWHLPQSQGGPQLATDSSLTFCVSRDPVERAFSQSRWAAARRTATKTDSSVQRSLAALATAPLYQDCHWMPQTEYLRDCDYVLRFEHLAADFCRFTQEQLGRDDCDLPKQQSSKKGKAVPTDVTADVRRLITEHYAEDVAFVARNYTGFLQGGAPASTPRVLTKARRFTLTTTRIVGAM